MTVRFKIVRIYARNVSTRTRTQALKQRRHRKREAPKPHKSGHEYRQFQAKMPKYENRSISKTVNPIKPNLRIKQKRPLHLVGGLPLP